MMQRWRGQGGRACGRVAWGLAAGLALGVVLGVGGCGGAAPTVSEVQQTYGMRFIEGVQLGSFGMVKAEGFDARAGELVSVSVDLGERGMVHARRATIVVDPATSTMRLRLLGVTLAPVGGTLETREEIWTDPVHLGRRVVADASGGG